VGALPQLRTNSYCSDNPSVAVSFASPSVAVSGWPLVTISPGVAVPSSPAIFRAFGRDVCGQQRVGLREPVVREPRLSREMSGSTAS
jgi:hypothetical protein